jgi:hypothetical protein
METYKKLSTPPPDALKTIQAGRLKGKSDINPQWRYEIMTSVFGVCGIGWKYEVINREFVSGANGEIAVFVDILLYVKVDDKWSEPIPANGGSMFIAKERNGMFTSDEAVKMATTDALGTAMKMIGVAADVYRGKKNDAPPQTKHDEDRTPKHIKKRNMTDEEFKNAVSSLKAGKSMKQLKDFANKKGVLIDEDTEFKLITASES